MAVSGTNTYNRTAGDLIDYALRKLRRVGDGQTAPARMSETALEELNIMFKEWSKYEWLWPLKEGSATLVADTANYTLSPRPYRVVSARFDDQDTETPLIWISREEYYDLPLKTNTGTPTQYYVDYQRASAVMYVWPVMASVVDETVNYTYQETFDDVALRAEDVDFRQEHYSLVGYNLAARLADTYGRDSRVTERVIARAEILLQEAQDEDREDCLRFVVGGF